MQKPQYKFSKLIELIIIEIIKKAIPFQGMAFFLIAL